MSRVIKADAMNQPDAPRARILNLADLAEQARTVVLDARRQAARIVAEAREKAEAEKAQAAERGLAEGLARGRDDGYAEGLRQGLQEARKEFDAEAGELTALARKILETLRDARKDLMGGGEAQVLEFALALARRIVGRVAATDVSAANANLAKVLELCGPGPIVVRVNPAQLEALQACAAELVRTLSIGGTVRLVADKQVAPGGVKADNGTGRIDATIEAQMDHVVRALLGGPAGEGQYAPTGGAARQQPAGEPSAKHVPA